MNLQSLPLPKSIASLFPYLPLGLPLHRDQGILFPPVHPRSLNLEMLLRREAWDCALNDPLTHLDFFEFRPAPEMDPREVPEGEGRRGAVGRVGSAE